MLMGQRFPRPSRRSSSTWTKSAEQILHSLAQLLQRAAGPGHQVEVARRCGTRIQALVIHEVMHRLMFCVVELDDDDVEPGQTPGRAGHEHEHLTCHALVGRVRLVQVGGMSHVARQVRGVVIVASMRRDSTMTRDAGRWLRASGGVNLVPLRRRLGPPALCGSGSSNPVLRRLSGRAERLPTLESPRWSGGLGASAMGPSD